jgi:hypothetical protein
MKLDDLDRLWRSPHNQPSAAQLEQNNIKFLTDLRRRHRGTVIFMIWILMVMTFLTGKVVVQLIWPDPALDRIDPAREWGFLLFMALPWACLLLFFRRYRQHRARHAGFAQSISASLRALLDENRIARERQKWVAGLWALMMVLMPLLVHQLRAAGKAGDEILIPAFVLLPLLMLGVSGWMLWRDRRVLGPRQRHLESLLASYDGAAPPVGN